MRRIPPICITLLLLLSFSPKPLRCQDEPDFTWYDEMDPDYKRGGVPQTLKLRVGYIERARFASIYSSVTDYVCLVEDQNNPDPKGIPTCRWIADWNVKEDAEAPWVDWEVSYYDLPRGMDKLYFIGMNNTAGLNLFWYPSRHFAITEADGSWPVDNSTTRITTTTATSTSASTTQTAITGSVLDSAITASPTSSTQPATSDRPTLNTGQIAGAIAGVLGATVILVLTASAWCLRERKKRQRLLSEKQKPPPSNEKGPEEAGNPLYEAEGGEGKPPELAGNAVFEAPTPNPEGSQGKVPVYALGADGQWITMVYELPVEGIASHKPVVQAPKYQIPAAHPTKTDESTQSKAEMSVSGTR
ncbi:hypothetical protein V8F20_006256 [Naviculisporaceae sp. PSN 640]